MKNLRKTIKMKNHQVRSRPSQLQFPFVRLILCHGLRATRVKDCKDIVKEGAEAERIGGT
jgi:hypothetical protein